jgi:hypothetical protein
VGYDVELVQVESPAGTRFPTSVESAKILLKKTTPLKDPATITQILSSLKGAKPGRGGTIDYVGKGLSYARFTVGKDRVHVDNNLNCAELLKVYDTLQAAAPNLLILDLQSGQLHDSTSYREWWAKPL